MADGYILIEIDLILVGKKKYVVVHILNSSFGSLVLSIATRVSMVGYDLCITMSPESGSFKKKQIRGNTLW